MVDYQARWSYPRVRIGSCGRMRHYNGGTMFLSPDLQYELLVLRLMVIQKQLRSTQTIVIESDAMISESWHAELQAYIQAGAPYGVTPPGLWQWLAEQASLAEDTVLALTA